MSFFLRLWIAFAISACLPAQAQSSLIDQVTFGPEFSFSRDDFVDDGGTKMKVLNNYLKLLRSREAENDFTVGSLLNRVVYPDFRINISTDPGTIEVTTTPGTLAEFEARAPRIQRDLFDAMAEVGVTPQEFRGGGHIHIGPQAFENNIQLFRNFLVDYYNHNGLAEGGLNFDPKNSKSMALESPRTKRKLRKLIEKIDNGNIKSFKRAYRKTSRILTGYKALRLNSSFMTVEIRAIRPQQSMEDFLKQIRLFSGRMEYLSSLDGPIPLQEWNPTRTSLEAINHMHSYVTESGLEWKDYRHMVLPSWQNPGGDLETFESRLAQRTCAKEMIDIFF